MPVGEMPMDVGALRLFVDVVECGSFTEAAKREYITQPALSRKIAGLEKYCGFKLLDRTCHPIVPTREGAALYETASRIVRSIDELDGRIASIRDGEGSTLSVVYTMGGHAPYVSDALSRLRQRYPKARVSVAHCYVPEAEALLANGGADVVVCNYPALKGVEGFERTPVMGCGLVALVPAGSSLANRYSLQLGELATERLFTFERTGSPDVFDAIVAACGTSGFDPDFCCFAPDPLTFSSMVNIHHAIGLIPATVLLTDKEGVRVIPIEDAPGFNIEVLRRVEDRRAVVDEFILAFEALHGHGREQLPGTSPERPGEPLQ